MPTGYVSSDSNLQEQQLQVQELVIRFADLQLYSASASTVTVNLQQTIVASVSALFLDDSAVSVAMISNANRVVSGTSVTLTLAAAFASNDVLILRYIVQS